MNSNQIPLVSIRQAIGVCLDCAYRSTQ